MLNIRVPVLLLAFHFNWIFIKVAFLLVFHLFFKNTRKVCNISYIVAHCLVQVCRTWLIVSGALTRYSLTILYNSTLKPLLNDNSIQHSLHNIAAWSIQCQSNTTFSTIAQKVLNANPLHWQTHIFCSCDVSWPTTKCSVHNASVELVGGQKKRENHYQVQCPDVERDKQSSSGLPAK